MYNSVATWLTQGLFSVIMTLMEDTMSTAKKLDSIGLRISTENKEIIRTAAQYTGQDLTSYLISTALDKAKKDIVEHKELQALLLSDRDFEKVEKEIKNSDEANGKLKKAFKDHSKKFEE